MRAAIFIFSALFVSLGCAKKDPFTRQSSDSTNRPGLIVIGVNKDELAFYLNANSLKARELGANTNVFDVEPTDVEEIKKAFPKAEIFKDKVFKLPKSDNRVVVDLSAKEARDISQQQLQSIDLKEAQQFATGEGVVVGVIDSGLNVNRYDLKTSIWKNPLEIPNNKIDDDKNGYVDDINGWNFAEGNNQLLDSDPHGTMSSAVISSPLTGIAPKSKVIGLRVTNNEGTGSISVVIEAILYARKVRVQIINLSMGTANLDPKLNKAINDLMADDIVLVQAAGNFAQGCKNNSSISSLYNFSKFISVAALNLSPANLDLAKYSNFGECIHIAAPAGEGHSDPDLFSRGIVAAHPYSLTKFYLYHGTSAAAPVVSGVAALVRSARPDLKASEVKQIILSSALREEALKGRIDNERSVNALSAVQAALDY